MSCGQLKFDNSIAYPLVTISVSPSPKVEDVRSLAQWNDLVYSAAGSGGILVYRLVGDNMDPVISLSLTNLYSEELENVYVRTVEIVETETATNLVFAYDTLVGGGIGIAEISETYTKPLGTLKTEPNIRIKNTVTSYNPTGVFNVLATSENIGVVSYDISFLSNNYFEQSSIASLVDYVSLLDIENPIQNFSALDAPNMRRVTNMGQITNTASLVQLALDNPQMFSSVISQVPFLTMEQKQQIQQVVSLTNQPLVSNILDIAQQTLGEDAVNQILADPNSINELLDNKWLKNVDLNSLVSGLGTENNNLLNQIKPDLVQQAESILDQGYSNTNIVKETDVNNVLSLSSLQELVQKETNREMFSEIIQDKETETLFEESLLSNIALTDKFKNNSTNIFSQRGQIGNARAEINRTVSALGRRFFAFSDNELKNRILDLNPDEMANLLSVIFEQAGTAISLIPLLESSGVRISELYQLWLQGDYYGIINSIDTTVIAEVLRKLPRYKVDTDFQIKQTNVVLPNIVNMYADKDTLYIAAGEEGFYIFDRLTGTQIASLQRPFSEVTMIIPHTVYGKNYYVVTDKLDGLTLYKREKNNKLGEQVSRLALVGESHSVSSYEDILWVADGSNGVLAVRINPDSSMVVEAELYDKEGIAYHIGATRRREVLVSYGADGLKRLRITNVVEDGLTAESFISLDQQKVEEASQRDFIDVLLNWGRNSSFALFIRRVFLP